MKANRLQTIGLENHSFRNARLEAQNCESSHRIVGADLSTCKVDLSFQEIGFRHGGEPKLLHVTKQL